MDSNSTPSPAAKPATSLSSGLLFLACAVTVAALLMMPWVSLGIALADHSSSPTQPAIQASLYSLYAH